jgi:pimeloyl-ACP methyl ester carboxylesterase
MSKWTKRVVFGLLALVGAILISGISFEQWSRWKVANEYMPPGRLVDVNGLNMHLNCSGAELPTVILESGLGYEGSLSWHSIQSEIATHNRVCSYDRAGILWSDKADGPLTAAATAERLHTLLGQASEQGPFVFVGHSIGGPLTMVYADKYPSEVAGIVLVDSSHPEQTDRLPLEVVELDSVQPMESFMYSVTAAFGVMRLTIPNPPEGTPERDVIADSFLPRTVSGLLDELTAVEQITTEAGEVEGFGELPLIVLTRGKLPEDLPPQITPEIISKTASIWSEMQGELASLSTNADHRVVDDAGHYIHHDNPEAVVRAIRDVVKAVQQND